LLGEIDPNSYFFKKDQFKLVFFAALTGKGQSGDKQTSLLRNSLK